MVGVTVVVGSKVVVEGVELGAEEVVDVGAIVGVAVLVGAVVVGAILVVG
jgi:hypothetical protein